MLQKFKQKKPVEILPIQGLRTSREQHVPDSSNHSLYLIKLFNSSSPEEHFGDCATYTTPHITQRTPTPTPTTHSSTAQHTTHTYNITRRQRETVKEDGERERKEDEREEKRRDKTRQDSRHLATFKEIHCYSCRLPEFVSNSLPAVHGKSLCVNTIQTIVEEDKHKNTKIVTRGRPHPDLS